MEIDFPFNLYLKACVRQLFVQLIHIHWGIWVAVCVLIQIHLLLQTTFDSAFRSGGSDDGNVTLLTEGDDGQGVELGLSMLDYMLFCAVGLIVWLIVVYLKVVHVQVRDAALRPTCTSTSPISTSTSELPSLPSHVQSCIFRSDMLNFNVVAEIMWEVQTARAQRERNEQANKRAMMRRTKTALDLSAADPRARRRCSRRRRRRPRKTRNAAQDARRRRRRPPADVEPRPRLAAAAERARDDRLGDGIDRPRREQAVRRR